MTDAKQNHAYIDTLRGLAILMVVLHHFAFVAKVRIPLLDVYGGLMGVQLFFVISGYLIARSAEASPLKNYAIARLARIFPAYWAIYLSVGFVMHGRHLDKIVQTPFPFVLNLLNLQQLDPVALLDFNVVGVSWTLTVEVIWYLLAPLMVLCWRGHRVLVLMALFLTSMGWTFLAEGGYLAHLYDARLDQVAAPLQRGQREMFIHSAFPAQLVHFGWGLAIYWYRIQLPRHMAVMAGLTGMLVLALMPQFLNKIPCSHVYSGFALALVFLAAKSLPGFHIPLMGSLGLVSYSVYLLHFPIIIYVFRRLDVGLLLQTLVTAGWVLALSYVSYRYIEKPSIRWGHKVSGRLLATA